MIDGRDSQTNCDAIRHLARIAEVRLKLYVVMSIVTFGLVLFVRPMRLHGGAVPAMVLLAVLGFVVMCLIMGLMMRASDQ